MRQLTRLEEDEGKIEDTEKEEREKEERIDPYKYLEDSQVRNIENTKERVSVSLSLFSLSL